MSWIPAGGAIHDGAFAKAHGIPGIPSESEWKPIERDIALCRETGCRYHVCHVSTKESVALIRQAKAEESTSPAKLDRTICCCVRMTCRTWGASR